MENLFIPILLATSRKERQSEKVANYTLDKVQTHGLDTKIVDTREILTPRTIPPWEKNIEQEYEQNIEKWREVMHKSDGLIAVIPEYNHSFPGEFKIVFDSLFEEYKKKPISICSVSSGGFGGVRMVEQVWTMVLAAQMVPTSYAVQFSNVKDLFDESGKLKQGEEEKYDKRMDKMIAETKLYAEAFKKVRERQSA